MPINFDSIANLSPEMQRIFVASMKAETKPIQTAQERKGNVEEKLKLVNTVLGKVEDVKKLIPGLNSPLSIKELNVASTDDKVATGSADKNVADVGEHSLEVMQLASAPTALSNRFPDKNETRIGTGYFTFKDPDGETKEVFIDNENATLEGVARAINTAGVGMKASVVNDQSDSENPYRLVLTGAGYGTEKNVEYPEFYFIDGDEDFFIEEEKAASNAKIKYQGFELESPTNELKELINGVTINLKGTTSDGHPLGISVEQDIDKTAIKMKEIITALNGVLGFIQEQNKMDAKTPGQKTLGGDYGIRMAEQRIREVMQRQFGGLGSEKIRIMADMGIEFQKDGLLKYDEKKFHNALDANFDDTVKVLAGDVARPGLMQNLNAVLTSLSASGSGILANEKATFTERVQRMNSDIDRKEKSLEKKAEMLKDKLAKIQGAFSKMQSQQGAVSGMGAPMGPGGGGGGGGGGGIPGAGG